MKQLKSFNPNNQAVAFAARKKHEPDKLDWILERLDKIESRLSNVETNQANDHKLIEQLTKN